MGCIICLNDPSYIVKNKSITTSNQIPDNISNYFTISPTKCPYNKTLSFKMCPTQETIDKATVNPTTTIQSFPLNCIDKSPCHKEPQHPSPSSYDSEVDSSGSIIRKPSNLSDSKIFIELFHSISKSQERINVPFDKLTFYKNIMFNSNGKIISKENSKVIYFSFGNDTSINIDSNSECKDNQFSKKEQNNIFNSKKVIDYNIQDPTIKPHQFDICYIAKSGLFYLKDVYTGSGVFYKLQTKMELPEEGKFLLTFSNIYFKLKVTLNDNFDSILTILFLDKNISNQEFEFNSTKINSFKIGRSNDCELSVKSSGVSRVQLTFIYENNIWSIYDGSIEKDNKQMLSTNGTWIQVNDSIKLTHGLLLKTGHVLMDVKRK